MVWHDLGWFRSYSFIISLRLILVRGEAGLPAIMSSRSC